MKVVYGEEAPEIGEGRPYVLLTRKRDLERFGGRVAVVVGEYGIVVCK